MNRRLNLRQTSLNPATNADSPAAHSFDIDIPALMLVLFRRRRLIVSTMAVVTVLACTWMLLTPNRYTSRAIILPSGKAPANLSALKAMVGLSASIGMSDDNASALFPLILGSHAVRDKVLAQHYEFRANGQDTSLTLPEYFGRTDPDKLRIALGNITSIQSDTKSGEIVVAVETRYPELSQAIVQEYLDRLEEFNLHERKSSATENVRYLSKQLDDARVKLDTAELALQKFRRENANWTELTSPEQITKQQRLLRENEIRNKAYLLLQEQYELAKLEAQKDVPIVNLLDEPSLPTMKSGPHRSVAVLATQAVVFALLVVVIFGMDIGRQVWRGGGSDASDQLRDDFRRTYPRLSRMLHIDQHSEPEAMPAERSPARTL